MADGPISARCVKKRLGSSMSARSKTRAAAGKQGCTHYYFHLAILRKRKSEMASSRDRRLFFRQVLFKDCAKLAGAHFDLMVSNDRETQKCLSHSDPRIRLAALKLMSFFWGPTPDFSQTRETLAFEDPDLDVRQMGILAIGTCYGGTNDFRIGKLLAEMVRNTAQPVECRRAAYQVLFYLRGKIFEAVASFHFPEEVDWTFVDSFVVRTDCF